MGQQFTIYQSTDSSAPTLSGTNGTLITVLDAILKDGYGSKTAAGWTKPYSGTNKAAYRQGGGNNFYLRVLDDGSGSGAAREAIIAGYESMSDVDTGERQFPNSVTTGATLYARKSTSADSTARAWIAFADDRTLYFFAATNDGGSTYIGLAFGDFYSPYPSDPGRCVIFSGNTANNATSQGFASLCAFNTSIASHYIARDHGGIRSSVLVGKHGDGVRGSTSAMIGALRFPHPDSLLYLSPVWIHDPTFDANSTYVVRGMLRGLWHGPYPVANVTHGDTISAMINGQAKTFQVVSSVRAGGSNAYCLIETSATLPTNPN